VRYLLPEQKRLVFEQTIPVRWGDLDAMRHLNNTTYFRYMETSRIDWMHSIGVRFDGDEGFVIVNAFCNFHRQISYPSEVLLKTYVSDPARTTLESWATMEVQGQPDVLYASGGATMIWMDYRSMKAAPLPGWVRDLAG
jgi:acyl-CoA thioester hydrolase